MTLPIHQAFARATACMDPSFSPALRVAAEDEAARLVQEWLATNPLNRTTVEGIITAVLNTGSEALVLRLYAVLAPVFDDHAPFPPRLLAWHGTPTATVGKFLCRIYTADNRHTDLEAFSALLRLTYGDTKVKASTVNAIHALCLHLLTLPLSPTDSKATRVLAAVRTRTAEGMFDGAGQGAATKPRKGLVALDAVLERVVAPQAWIDSHASMTEVWRDPTYDSALAVLYAIAGPSVALQAIAVQPDHRHPNRTRPGASASHHDTLAFLHREMPPRDTLRHATAIQAQALVRAHRAAL